MMYSDIIRKAVRTAATIGYAVRRDPYGTGNKRNQMASVRPAPIMEWVVDRESLAQEVKRRVVDFPPGTVKQLVAGTSAGKTTRMPLDIAQQLNAVVIVALPDYGTSEHALAYVKEAVAPSYGMENSVFQLSTGLLEKPRRGAAVYYTVTGELLAIICANPGILSKAGVKVVVIDESHKKRPEYRVLRRLVSAGEFSDVVLIYASATVASDLLLESTPSRTVMPVSPSVLAAVPAQNRPESPAHYTRITGRTIMFCADDDEIDQWALYYKSHDIPTYKCGYSASTLEKLDIKKYLKVNSLCVVLTTSVLETSYTFECDCVIDLGYTSVLRSDYSVPKLTVTRIPVTRAQRTQRAGRVGRVIPGVAYYADIVPSLESTEDDVDLCAYEYLWTRMFSMTVNDPSISRFESIFGTLSLRAVAQLLTFVLPPLVMLPYMGDEGVYSMWEKAAKSLRPHGLPLAISNDFDRKKLAQWPEYTICFDDDMGDTDVYQSRVAVEGPLEPLVYHLWQAEADAVVPDDIDAFTVYAGSISRTNRVKSVLKFKKPDPERATNTRPFSTVGSDFGTVVHRPHTRTASAPLIPALPALPPVAEASTITARQWFGEPEESGDVLPPLPSYHTVERPVDVTKWAQRSSSLSSHSSDEPLELRQVDPLKYWRDVLYPMDPELLALYLNASASTERDMRRFRALVNGSASYASLSEDTSINKHKQREYFLSLVRMHNTFLTQMLQCMVTQTDRSRWRTFARQTFDADVYANKATQAAGLLKVAATVLLYVGINKKANHSSHSGMPLANTNLLRTARISLNMGSERVKEFVEGLVSYAVPVPCDNNLHRASAAGWSINGVQFTVDHAYEELSDTSRAGWAADARTPVVVSNGVASCDAFEYNQCFWRPVIDGERVYVVYPDMRRGRSVVFGSFLVQITDYLCCIDGVLSSGYSGSLVVSAGDGAVLGLYRGLYMKMGDKSYSVVIPLASLFGGTPI